MKDVNADLTKREEEYQQRRAHQAAEKAKREQRAKDVAANVMTVTAFLGRYGYETPNGKKFHECDKVEAIEELTRQMKIVNSMEAGQTVRDVIHKLGGGHTIQEIANSQQAILDHAPRGGKKK